MDRHGNEYLWAMIEFLQYLFVITGAIVWGIVGLGFLALMALYVWFEIGLRTEMRYWRQKSAKTE